VSVTLLLLSAAFLRFINYCTPTDALLYIVFSLKFTLQHLKFSYMFRSSDDDDDDDDLRIEICRSILSVLI
jgi:hypothetical protein